MTTIRESWEARAQSMGATRRGVLFKGFSEPGNAMLDAWHKRLVREVLEPELPAGGAVLDIGCGYGRLTRMLAQDRVDIMPVGQDISFRYCVLLAAAGGLAVQGDQTALPYKAGSFAGALAVTTLMYADRNMVADILRKIREVLRPGAPFLIVDPGEELRAKIERTGGRRVTTTTGGRGFLRDEYRRLALAAGFLVTRYGGNPHDSLLLLLTLGGKVGWRWTSRLLPRDGVESGYSTLALHRWLLLRAPAKQMRSEPST
jgi:SAM-dependent methyltransferase